MGPGSDATEDNDRRGRREIGCGGGGGRGGGENGGEEVSVGMGDDELQRPYGHQTEGIC